MMAAAPSFVAEDDVGIRTAAALLVMPDGRYLMQLRDDKPGIPLPNTWALFGGTIDDGEGPQQAVHRELMEELELKLVLPVRNAHDHQKSTTGGG